MYINTLEHPIYVNNKSARTIFTGSDFGITRATETPCYATIPTFPASHRRTHEMKRLQYLK